MTAGAGSASYRFTTGAASSWGGVTMRVITPDADTLDAAFRVAVRPRQPVILAIDSTDTTITVHWAQTQEQDFAQYRLYRGVAPDVDTAGELWASIGLAQTLSYTTPRPGYTRTPRYYRLYQADAEGLSSEGSAPVFGDITNAAPTVPLLLTPDNNGDTLWSNAVIRWTRSADFNGDPVTYRLLLDPAASGYAALASAITDTFFRLAGPDTLSFGANVKVIADDGHGDTSFDEKTAVFFKRFRFGRLRAVPAGSFIDSADNTATVSHDLYIDTAEVSQSMFQAVMGFNPSPTVDPNAPVRGVTWYQAILYCNALSKVLHLDTVYTYSAISSTAAENLACDWQLPGVRLPTADEWELAAHGGSNLSYATDDGGLSCEKANYGSCGAGAPAAIGSYAPNPYGMHDMTGNVAEWCWDLTGASGRVNGRIDYAGSDTASQNRIRRGGDYAETNVNALLTTSIRAVRPDFGSIRTGFRCAVPDVR
jgi:formylglycine-generating enzyme required for sulfatase activity